MEKAEAKKKIKRLREAIRRCEYAITETADTFLVGENKIPSIDTFTGEEVKGLFDDAQWFHVSTEWDCPESPFGWCMYHIIHDPSRDNCIFCHEPKERK